MNAAAAPLLAARALAVRAGARALVEALDLEVRPGEFVAVLGRNGSGKTTLLRTLAGLRVPAAGSLQLLGDSPATLTRREVARRVALLPQDLEEMPGASVLETVLVGRYAHRGALGGDDPRDAQQALEALRRLQVEALAGREFATLSGGEQRRVAAAAVLVQAAPLVLLDEPTAHLDPGTEAVVLDALRRLCVGRTAILASHARAARVGHGRVLELSHGRAGASRMAGN